MAAVFLAEHIALRRRVALKILHPPPDAEETGNYAQRFRLEAETLATLDHPNIVTLYDYGGAEEGRFYLAMEYIEGPRYTDILANGALDPDRTIRLLLQVCAALRYAHKRGVVHRDLKPSNLLIRTDTDGAEQVKVVDFGLVKVTEIDQHLTREGLVLGSPHCMAPEQVRGSAEIDHRADIYAIGVLLFRSLTGTYPFHGATSTATMVAHLNEPVPTFASVAPELRVASKLEDIVRRCLAKRPQDRYPDVKALMEDLAACVGASAEPDTQSISHKNPVPTVTDPTPPIAPAAEKRDRRPLLALLALLFLLSLSGIAYLFGARDGADPVAPANVPAQPAPKPPEAAKPPEPGPQGAGDGAKPADPVPPGDVVVDPKATPEGDAKVVAPDQPPAQQTRRDTRRTRQDRDEAKPPPPPKTDVVPSSTPKADSPPPGYMPMPDDFK